MRVSSGSKRLYQCGNCFNWKTAHQMGTRGAARGGKCKSCKATWWKHSRRDARRQLAASVVAVADELIALDFPNWICDSVIREWLDAAGNWSDEIYYRTDLRDGLDRSRVECSPAEIVRQCGNSGFNRVRCGSEVVSACGTLIYASERGIREEEVCGPAPGSVTLDMME